MNIVKNFEKIGSFINFRILELTEKSASDEKAG